MNVYEGIFKYGNMIYQNALAHFEREQYRLVQIKASASAGAIGYLIGVPETPPAIRQMAAQLFSAIDNLISEARKAEVQKYGEKFLSGSKTKKAGEKWEVQEFMEDLIEMARESSES